MSEPIYTNRYVYNLHYHLIWCTKHRNKIFNTNKSKIKMKDILKKVAFDNEITLENIDIEPDCIKLIINFPPRKSAVDVIKALKGRSAFIFLKQHPELNEMINEFQGGHLWSSSYYIGSLGDMNKSTIENYINNKKYNACKKQFLNTKT